jgi:transcriptional regulator PpsR
MQNLDPVAQRFSSPQVYLAELDADVASALLSAAADIALVLDGQGVIRDVSLGNGLSDEGPDLQRWIGQPWTETLTVESRKKSQEMLAAALARDPGSTVPTERQLNHVLAGGRELPMVYSAVPLGRQGLVLALGRDLRPEAAAQQRLIDAQHAMERDYLRLRQAEARYRALFEAVEEAVVIVDAVSLAVADLNPAAQALLGDPGRRAIGRALPDMFAPVAQPDVVAHLAQARNQGRCADVDVALASQVKVTLGASTFRQDGASLLLVRLSRTDGAPLRDDAANGDRHHLWEVMNAMPDAFVLTDMQGRVLAANRSFTRLLHLQDQQSLQGQPLERWLGRSSIDLNVLITNLRQHGVLRLFPTTLRLAGNDTVAVEISAIAVADGPQPCLAFSIRDVSRRLPDSNGNARQMPRSADQLASLVGRLPLRDIVGETTDLIERLCIEAALQLTNDNRASAAEMLGLSRQSLYVKMRRFGLQERSADEPEGSD